MKEKICSVMVFPFNNKLEVKVTRAKDFMTPPVKVNCYSCSYNDERKVMRLVELANKLNGLVLKKMVTSHRITNPLGMGLK